MVQVSKLFWWVFFLSYFLLTFNFKALCKNLFSFRTNSRDQKKTGTSWLAHNSCCEFLWIISWGIYWRKSNCNIIVTLCIRSLFSQINLCISENVIASVNLMCPGITAIKLPCSLLCVFALDGYFLTKVISSTYMYWHSEVNMPAEGSISASITASCPRWIFVAWAFIKKTDRCKMTLAYEFSMCTPQAHSVIGGWGKHRLIIVNNLQAGAELKTGDEMKEGISGRTL